MIEESNINNIIHDLKTPITSIIGFVELLQKGSYDEKTQREFYDILASESNRLLMMVNDMIYISKSQENIDEKNCNVNIEITKYVKALTPLANKRNIDISINVNAESIYVSIPEVKIARILTNIIENAIKYNKENGKIFIDVHEESNRVFIKIKDTGIGIAQHELNKIFDKHYRSDASKHLDIHGSGLGLSIAKDLAESYGGNIEVSSELDKSTEFIISFPSSHIKK